MYVDDVVYVVAVLIWWQFGIGKHFEDTSFAYEMICFSLERFIGWLVEWPLSYVIAVKLYMSIHIGFVYNCISLENYRIFLCNQEALAVLCIEHMQYLCIFSLSTTFAI